MTAWREFRFARGKAAPLIWKIKQEGDRYLTSHGILDGAMQEFSDQPGDKGKAGTKAYVDAIENCTFHVEREVRKKVEHGYIEYVNGKPTEEQITEVRFDKTLPKNFCGYKPQTDIEPKALEKLHKTGKATYTRKYDGMCHVAVHHKTGWEIYTRRMDLATEKFPHHLKELEAHTEFGVGTVLVGECVCPKSDGKDDFKSVSRFCRSLVDEARKLVEDKEIPEPKFLVFDILFHNGKDLKTESYSTRAKLWNSLPHEKSKSLVCQVEKFNLTPTTWEKYAKDHGWEGFVVTDGASVPGDKFYSFDGDAKRPKGHHKLKPLYEDDVVIYAAALGTGKYLGKIGAAYIKQRYPDGHPQAGKWFNCGKVGSGFDDESRAELEDLCHKHSVPILEKDKEAEKLNIENEKGIVAMIEYGERQPGTQKFRFPVFVRTRFDKAAKECKAQRLAADEE